MSEIEQLKANARDLSGGQMLEGSGKQPLPLAVQHQFWKNVFDFESASRKIRRQILAEDGFHAPPEQGLSDAELTHQLWNVSSRRRRKSCHPRLSGIVTLVFTNTADPATKTGRTSICATMPTSRHGQAGLIGSPGRSPPTAHLRMIEIALSPKQLRRLTCRRRAQREFCGSL